MYILGIIPSRANSIGLPHKNTLLLNGKPLIVHTIELAKKCSLLTNTVICTNDEEVMKIAKINNMSVPFIEPEYLATPSISMLEVLQYTVKQVESRERVTVDIIVLLDPTSPFRRIEDVENCITHLIENKYDSVVTVCEYEHNPHFVGVIIKDNVIKPMIDGRDKITTRQQAPTAYRINAGVYAITRHTLIYKNKIFTEDTGVIVMPQLLSAHIDHEIDLQYAEFLMEKKLI